MTVTIKYFGIIAELVNTPEEKLEIEVESQLDFRAFINSKHPQILKINYKIAINQVFTDILVNSDQKIEIAILPPFAGG